VTRAEIQSFFPGLPVNFGGMNFAVPTLAWLQGPCFEYFKARYWNLNLDKWQFKWECRDFARAFAVCAHECHALSPDAPAESDALAVGESWFIPEASRIANPLFPAGHAINACFTDQGLVYLDPQTGLLWLLNSTEFQSQFFVRF
jgi:hypothetical protein